MAKKLPSYPPEFRRRFREGSIAPCFHTMGRAGPEPQTSPGAIVDSRLPGLGVQVSRRGPSEPPADALCGGFQIVGGKARRRFPSRDSLATRDRWGENVS
jgi:hypothetical protein